MKVGGGGGGGGVTGVIQWAPVRQAAPPLHGQRVPHTAAQAYHDTALAYRSAQTSLAQTQPGLP